MDNDAKFVKLSLYSNPPPIIIIIIRKKSVLILVSNRTILKTVSFEPLIIIPAQTIDLQAVSWPGEFC